MRAFCSYWWRCIRIAAKGSCEFANDWQWLFGVPVLAGFLVMLTGEPEIKFIEHTILNGMLAAATVFALTFGIRFLYMLIAAPVKLDVEMEQRVRELERSLDNREERQATINALWELRRLGVELRNESVKSEAELLAWMPRYGKRRADVLSAAERFGPNLKYRLEVLDRLRDPPNLPVFDRTHGTAITVMSEILLRMGENLPK